ncbi:hypothetical protein Pla175_46370 [Pirellulimonas nuda]|uniref:Response regulatory domain-containing protein n=1 Tax=Pirellulimonas nuda TaxID=2528009 RepID=A0A518DIA6_9BACT|nr:hypothetical protein [Pirellulimonas nuda]QDU91217.1 hypothetical protein Pla175_46370 [Pirellulimonas nuda]
MRVALRGDARDASFGPALLCVAQSREAGRIQFVDDPGAAELCLWFRDRPERHAGDGPRESAGAAETVAVLGSWCEGETRTGRPTEGVERVYWYDFPAWWRAREPHAAGTIPLAARPTAAVPAAGHVEVAAPDRASAAAVIDTLEDAGRAAVWRRPHQAAVLATRPTAGVWVGGQLDGREAALLCDFASRFRARGLPLAVLLDFPRLDSWRAAHDMGATSTLGKPWQAEALLLALAPTAVPARADNAAIAPRRIAA